MILSSDRPPWRKSPVLTRRALLGTLTTLLLPQIAQAQPRVPEVGYLSLAPGPSPRSEALRQGFRELGYVEGKTLRIEYRWAAGHFDAAEKAAADLRERVDVVVTGGPQATLAAKHATSTTPIVMAFDYDPVGAGFVSSLAQPGGNITGLTGMNPELTGKRLEILRQAAPALSRVAIIWNPMEPNGAFLRETQSAGRAIGMQLHVLEVKAPSGLEPAVRAAKAWRANGLIVLTDPITLYHRTQLAELAARYHLPAIYSERLFTEAGGLMSYGANDRELHHRAAIFVDRILKGARPADLPVEQPTTYELVINLAAARGLGLAIPPTLQQRADQLIE